MTSEFSSPRGGFDWEAAEADIIDLDTARSRRSSGDRSPGLDTHFSVDLDEAPVVGGALIDPPAPRDGPRPIIPSHLSTWASAKSTIRYAIDRALHVAAFHSVRVPWYAAQAGFWASVGVFRLRRPSAALVVAVRAVRAAAECRRRR